MRSVHRAETKSQPLHLRPCPFCGEGPDIFPLNPSVEGDAWTRIACVNATCSVAPSVSVYKDRGHRQDAARKWNRRA